MNEIICKNELISETHGVTTCQQNLNEYFISHFGNSYKLKRYRL